MISLALRAFRKLWHWLRTPARETMSTDWIQHQNIVIATTFYHDKHHVMKEKKYWALAVNGGEYHPPVWFCPYCGDELPPIQHAISVAI